MHALAQVPQLLPGDGQVVPYLFQVGADAGRDPVADTAQQQRLGDQALLDAVGIRRQRRHRREHLLRRRPASHQGRDPAQRRLLLGDPAQIRVRLRVGDRGRD